MSRSAVSAGGVDLPKPNESAPATTFRFALAASFVRDRVWELAVWAAMLGWWIGLFAVARSDYLNFRSARLDLGNMVQAVWSTAHGRPLEVTMVTGEQGIRLAGHVDPFLALLAPLWIVAPTPLMLPAVQIAAVSLGALPVFWLARRHLGSDNVAGLLALSYLAYPWLAWNAIEQVHPVTFAIPLFLFALWFLDSDRLWAFAICAVLAALTGELMGLTIAALGLWYALTVKRPIGLLVAGLGAGWTLMALYVVVPAFSGGSSVFYGYYGSVGGSPLGVVRTALTDPGTIVSALTTGDDVRYLVALSLPLVGLFLLAPGLAAVSLPQLLANGLSDSTVMTSQAHHYTSAAIPFLVAATILGVARIRAGRRRPLVMLVLATCVGFSLVFPAWPGAPVNSRLWYADVPASKVEALRAAVAVVPEDAPVSATNKAASHLSARRYVYTVPTLGRAEWIVLDTSDTWIPEIVAGRENPELLREFLRRVETSAEWGKVLERDGVFAFRRVPARGSAP